MVAVVYKQLMQEREMEIERKTIALNLGAVSNVTRQNVLSMSRRRVDEVIFQSNLIMFERIRVLLKLYRKHLSINPYGKICKKRHLLRRIFSRSK